MNQHLRRFKPTLSLKQRLAERVRMHVEAKLAVGAEREGPLQEAQQADATAHIDQLRRSLGLKPPG